MTRMLGVMLVAAVMVLLAGTALAQDDGQRASLQDSRQAQMTGAMAETQGDIDQMQGAVDQMQGAVDQMQGAIDQTSESAADDEVVVSESVKAFIDKGKPIGHVIIVLLIIGVFFTLDQARVHFLEKVRGGPIYKAEIVNMERGTVEDLIIANERSRIGRLLKDVSRIYRQSADMSLISAEAALYREKEEHRFNTFEARMAFLADTAGGLGLLGTVWGIYRGFAAKSVAANNDDLLAAMGIALVTTFMGIVVSVILNWMSTEMGAMFRGRIMHGLEKVEDFREMLVKDMGRAA